MAYTYSHSVCKTGSGLDPSRFGFQHPNPFQNLRRYTLKFKIANSVVLGIAPEAYS